MTLRIANIDDQPFGEFDPELADAVRYGDLDRVSELLNAGADPNAVDSRGEHVLLIAIRYEYGEIATLLISGGARTDSYTASGASPLWLASTLGLDTVVKALIAVGASVNEAADDHSTPLSAALQAGHWSLGNFLRRQGGTILEQDAYHAEMDRSYAIPGFDFATADTPG
jgi:ankyrin repeat protein